METEEEEVEKEIKCEICEHVLGKDTVVDEDDVKEYVRSILGNTTFTKKYSVFKGTLDVTFKSLTAMQTENLNSALSSIFKNTEAGDEAIHIDKGAKYKLVYYLAEYGDKKFEPVPPSIKVEDLEKLYQERLGGVNSNLVELFIKVLIEFVRLQKLLVETGLDSNFWKGAGLH